MAAKQRTVNVYLEGLNRSLGMSLSVPLLEPGDLEGIAWKRPRREGWGPVAKFDGDVAGSGYGAREARGTWRAPKGAPNPTTGWRRT